MSHASLFLPTPVRVSRSKEPVLLCWKCGDFLAEESLAELRATQLCCPQCGTVTVCKEGIWRCLSIDQAKRYERFITEYESIRASEGRGSMDAAYYLNLPLPGHLWNEQQPMENPRRDLPLCGARAAHAVSPPVKRAPCTYSISERGTDGSAIGWPCWDMLR